MHTNCTVSRWHFRISSELVCTECWIQRKSYATQKQGIASESKVRLTSSMLWMVGKKRGEVKNCVRARSISIFVFSAIVIMRMTVIINNLHESCNEILSFLFIHFRCIIFALLLVLSSLVLNKCLHIVALQFAFLFTHTQMVVRFQNFHISSRKFIVFFSSFSQHFIYIFSGF